MATDHIRYDVLARDALRGVLRRVLTDAAEHGLPGEHHFFITFLSTADGVKLSPRLRGLRRGRTRIDEGVKGVFFPGMVPPLSGYAIVANDNYAPVAQAA